MPRPDLVRVVPGHNSRESLSLLRSIEPDVIAVYGTAMIRPPVIALARKAIINMHTGLSPFYRGSDTIFWALHDERLDLVGVTIHLLDPGIDSGAIISATRLSIDPTDNEDSLFAKAVVVGAERYIEAIRMAASGDLRALPQSLQVGREFRFVDRTMAAERRVDRLVAGGICRRFADSSGAASDQS
jgi:methionyl-tRNA formyltransferase